MCMFVQWRGKFYASSAVQWHYLMGTPENLRPQDLPLVTAKGGLYNPPWLGPSAEKGYGIVPVPSSIGTGHGGQSHRWVIATNPLGTNPLRWFFKRFSSRRLESVPNLGEISSLSPFSKRANSIAHPPRSVVLPITHRREPRSTSCLCFASSSLQPPVKALPGEDHAQVSSIGLDSLPRESGTLNCRRAFSGPFLAVSACRSKRDSGGGEEFRHAKRRIALLLR